MFGAQGILLSARHIALNLGKLICEDKADKLLINLEYTNLFCDAVVSD